MGDGEHIDIRKETWIPNLESGWLKSLPPSPNIPSKVLALINKSSWTWNLDPISSHISLLEQEAISKIPLSPLLCHDELIWKHDKKRFFFSQVGLCFSYLSKPPISLAANMTFVLAQQNQNLPMEGMFGHSTSPGNLSHSHPLHLQIVPPLHQSNKIHPPLFDHISNLSGISSWCPIILYTIPFNPSKIGFSILPLIAGHPPLLLISCSLPLRSVVGSYGVTVMPFISRILLLTSIGLCFIITSCAAT